MIWADRSSGSNANRYVYTISFISFLIVWHKVNQFLAMCLLMIMMIGFFFFFFSHLISASRFAYLISIKFACTKFASMHFRWFEMRRQPRVHWCLSRCSCLKRAHFFVCSLCRRHTVQFYRLPYQCDLYIIFFWGEAIELRVYITVGFDFIFGLLWFGSLKYLTLQLILQTKLVTKQSVGDWT